MFVLTHLFPIAVGFILRFTQTLRGQGGNYAYIDEIAYIKPKLFYMIVVPLLEVKDTVLVAISTLVDQWNFFSVLMELKDPKGENVFNVYRQQLVCNRCMDRKNPEKCTHNDHMIPPWKSKRQVETARLIFGDDTGALKSESLGLVDGNTGSVFSAVSIKNLRAAALYDVATTNDAPPKFVFVACDPNAGGPDHTAIVALAHIAGRIVVRVVVVRVVVVVAELLLLLLWQKRRTRYLNKQEEHKKVHIPGFEPGTKAWKTFMLPITPNVLVLHLQLVILKRHGTSIVGNMSCLRSQNSCDQRILLDKISHHSKWRGGHGVFVRSHGGGNQWSEWSAVDIRGWFGKLQDATIGMGQRWYRRIHGPSLRHTHPQLSDAPKAYWMTRFVHLTAIASE